MRLDPISLYDYEARAQQMLPHDYWDFIAGGSKDELTTQRNRSAFDAMSLRPRFLRDVTERKLATTVLGTPISFPVMISPTGGHKAGAPGRRMRHGAGGWDVPDPDDAQHLVPL